MTIPLDALWMFGLTLVRMSGLFVVAPVFSSAAVTAKVKVGLLILLSLTIAFSLPLPKLQMSSLAAILPAIIGEFMVGLLLGLGYRLAMTAVTTAGEIIGLQMGLGAASLIDQNSGQSAALAANFYGIVFTMLFLAFDGHHHMLTVLRESYNAVPAATALNKMPPVELLMLQTSQTLAFGCRLAAPILIPLIMLAIAMGLLSRVFPQANIYSLSYGMAMLAGIALLGLSAPGLREGILEGVRSADRGALKLLQAFAGA